jgi:hypothetical protein
VDVHRCKVTERRQCYDVREMPGNEEYVRVDSNRMTDDRQTGMGQPGPDPAYDPEAHYLPYPAPPAQKRPSARMWVLAVASLVVVAGASVGITLALANGSTSSGTGCGIVGQKPPCYDENGQWIRAAGASGTTSPPTTSTNYTYTGPLTTRYSPPPMNNSDFTIGLKTVSKQCFGSAGCTLVVEPTITYNGGVGTSDFGSCDITYTIKGDDSGEVVETAYGQGGTQFRISRSALATKSSKVNPTATVTSVSCN